MIYLDNHATTRCDPRVVESMLPWFSEHYGNPHSNHEAGRIAADAMERSIEEIAALLKVGRETVVITSGATESNNLAIRGVCTHPRQKRRHLVTVTTEHPAVLDVSKELEIEGFRVTRVPVTPNGRQGAGNVDLDLLADAVDEETALVSVMWANNEIGAIAPMKEIAEICDRHGALLHSDATQAVGRLAVDVPSIGLDLLSATAHKFYGPKGTGLLLVGSAGRRVRLRPQIVGGGQQRALRSGTMNPAGVIGMATALRLCVESLQSQADPHSGTVVQLRDRLWQRLSAAIDGLVVNGPPLQSPALQSPALQSPALQSPALQSPALQKPDRLPGNLNLMLPEIEGQAWMSATPNVLFSSGSACSGHEPAPSHVLTALGLSESEARRSVRFGVGRFNTVEEIDEAADALIASYRKLAALAH